MGRFRKTRSGEVVFENSAPDRLSGWWLGLARRKVGASGLPPEQCTHDGPILAYFLGLSGDAEYCARCGVRLGKDGGAR